MQVEPETRLDLLERVNRLNILGYDKGECYWTVTVMYNTVIWKRSKYGLESMLEVIEGIPK
jgi:hypothetical protein